jgi:signal transduction histidine kinase
VPTYVTLLRAVHPADRARVHRALWDAWRRRASVQLDLRVRRPDGEERSLHLRGEPRRDAGARTDRVVGTMLDVTERVAAERAMRDAKERAEAADRTKQRLLAMASHDLRTPLTAIRGAIELLQRESTEGLSDEQRELLKIAHGNVERLAALVADLLDLARIEAGRLALRVQWAICA